MSKNVQSNSSFRPQLGDVWPADQTHHAFTLIELLVVMSVIALISALLLPSLSRGKAAGKRVSCMNNQKQLGLAWELYSQDNTEKLADTSHWVGNHLVYYEDCINPELMLDPSKSLFAPYIRALETYKDPGSKGTTCTGDTAPLEKPLPRSYALNFWAGPPAAANGSIRQMLTISSPCHQFTKTSEMTAPAPSAVFTFVDVNPDSICAPCFGVYMTRSGDERFCHFPATYHNGRGVISFADGHAETHKWVDDRSHGTTLDYHFGPNAHNYPSSLNRDVIWLQAHATSLAQ